MLGSFGFLKTFECFSCYNQIKNKTLTRIFYKIFILIVISKNFKFILRTHNFTEYAKNIVFLTS